MPDTSDATRGPRHDREYVDYTFTIFGPHDRTAVEDYLESAVWDALEKLVKTDVHLGSVRDVLDDRDPA